MIPILKYEAMLGNNSVNMNRLTFRIFLKKRIGLIRIIDEIFPYFEFFSKEDSCCPKQSMFKPNPTEAMQLRKYFLENSRPSTYSLSSWEWRYSTN